MARGASRRWLALWCALAGLWAAPARAGTLAPFVQTYWRRLNEQRYAPETARAYLYCVAHFAHWSMRRQFTLSALDHQVECFLM